ncbi:MAG: hypothetical protein WCY11_05490 [Novosphingobium sp.]
MAGIVMFLMQGLPPKNWRMTSGILALWVAILALLAFMMAGYFAFGLTAMEMLYRFPPGGQ